MLKKPRIGHSLSSSDLHKLRSGLSKLKSSGIIPASRNLSKANSFYTFAGVGPGGSTLNAIDLVNKYDAIIHGKASAIKTSDLKGPEKKEYEKLYAKARSGDILIVDHSPDETVKVVKGKVIITHPAGIERIQIPVKFHNLEQYLSDVQSTIPELEKQRHGHAMFAFRFYGGSSAPYRTMNLLLEDLTRYKTVVDSISRGDVKLQREIFRNLEIVIVKSSPYWYKQKRENKAKLKAKRGKRRKNESRF